MIRGARVKDPSFKWRRLWNKGNRITGMNNKGNWFSDTDNGRSDSNRSGPRHDDLCEMEEKSCWKSPKTIKSTSELDRGGSATAGAESWLPETEARADMMAARGSHAQRKERHVYRSVTAGKLPWCSPEDCAAVCGGGLWRVALRQGQLVIAQLGRVEPLVIHTVTL
jgi:hypothetical protein